MPNPIALALILIGSLLLLFGIVLLIGRRTAAGIVLSLLGLSAAATPFIITFHLLAP